MLAQQGGEGKAANAPEANKLLKLASDQGDPFAMMAYGRNLIMGEGVDKNVELVVPGGIAGTAAAQGRRVYL